MGKAQTENCQSLFSIIMDGIVPLCGMWIASPNLMQKSFPKRLEEQVARLSAYMSLPDPASGNSFFRLVRLPSRGRETVVDLSSCGFRYRLRVTRFLKSMRQNLLHYDSNSNEPPQRTNPSIEISSSYLNANDSAIKMFDHLNFNDFSNDLEDDMHADHFFLFY